MLTIIEISLKVSQKLNMDLSKGLAVSLLCLYLKVSKSVYNGDTSIPMYIRAQFIKIKICISLTAHQMNELIKKIW